MSHHIAIWQDKIILRTKEEIHPDLKPYAKYNDRVSGYLLYFGKQNLQRIFNAYGQLPVSRGQERIDELKIKLSELKTITQKVATVKSSAQLPAIAFKLPPLGEYQHRGVWFLLENKRAPLFADCGCLSGDTLIKVSRGGCSKTVALRDLHKSWFTPRKNAKHDIYVRSLKASHIGLHRVSKVLEQGKKPVFMVSLNDGKTIKATRDHELMTERGWVQVSDLTTQDSVMGDNLKRHQKKKVKVGPKRNPDRRLAVGPHHPYARKQPSHQGRSYSYLVEIHRLVCEAYLNQISLEHFIYMTYHGFPESIQPVFVDPKEFVVHHVNGDHYDNRPENLKLMPHSEHMALHTAGYSNFGHGAPEYSKVVSVKAAGVEMTYDIVCEDPHRNFVANGIVVHNCGKTYMSLVATEEQIKAGLIEPGKVLICAKLATLETAWLDDCMKFTDLKANVVWLPAGSKRKEKLLGILDDPADIYIINHDGVMVLEEELVAKKFQKVVVDESTILKSYHGDFTRSGGKFGKALMNVAQHASWRVVMSGTPAPNGPEDLWGQFKFLDPEGFLLEPSFYDFRAEYMDEICYGKNPATSFKKYVFRRDMTPHIKAAVDTLAYQVKIRDHLHDLPPKTVIARRIRMSEEQHKHYENMLMNLATLINDEFVSIDVRLAQIAKLRQITGGFLIDQEEVPHGIETATKLEALDCLMEELGDNKIVIYAQYRWEIKTIAERYKDLGLVTVYGNNKSEDNLENIKSFIQNEKVKVIVLHPKSAAHGVTFTVSHYMIFYSSSYSAEDDYQCVKRIERAGQKHPIFIYYLVSALQKPIGKHKESIDEIMYRVIQIKSKNQSELIDQGEIYKEMFSALA